VWRFDAGGLRDTGANAEARSHLTRDWVVAESLVRLEGFSARS